MSITDPIDTLAYHQSRVLTTPRNMAEVPMHLLSPQIKKYEADKGMVYPEAEALWFYGMNHGMSLIQTKYAPLEPMSALDLAFVEEYHRRMGDSAVRAFYYLMLICVRESRHNLNAKANEGKLIAEFGAAVAQFHVMGGGESGIQQKLLDSPPDCTVGQLTKSLCWVYYNCKWNSGYGGKAWGAVADCLNRFVHGNYSAEMMLDTVWTLAHNNGPIFNKHVLYHMYNPQEIIKLLDVQRSGQIPELILHTKLAPEHAQSELKHRMAQLNAEFPGAIGQYVDWYAVEALGSKGKYHKEKQLQLAKHGASQLASAAEKKAAAAAQAKEQAELQAKLEHIKSFFVIGPKEGGGFEELKKITINRAA